MKQNNGKLIENHEEVVSLIFAEIPYLRRVARKLTRCEADADDLLQDTLLRAYRARDRFELGTSIRAWVATIMRRVFLTNAIRNKRRGMETDTDAGEPIAHAVNGRRVDAKQEILPDFIDIIEGMDGSVKRAIEKIPEKYLLPFLLSVIDKWTCAKIAETLGVPEGTVMSRIHRARQRLRKELGLYWASPKKSKNQKAPEKEVLHVE